MIRQLSQMTRLVQRHRGMSMALLGGNSLFRGDFETLQKQLERRLTAIEAFAALTGLLSEREKENLHSAWQTVCVDWQNDDVIDNFELHAHFIELLQAMVVGLSRELECPLTIDIAANRELDLPPEDSNAHPKMFKQLELLSFAVRQAPEMIEQVGRIRGLATYAAAKGYCDYHHDRKLRYVIGCARASNEKLRHQSERLESILGGTLSTLSLIKTYELKFMFLLNTVEMDILSGATMTTNSAQVFKLATEIMDVYLKVVDEAIDTLSAWHEQELEAWLRLA